MKLVLTILISFSAILFTSCKPKIQKERVAPNLSGAKAPPAPSSVRPPSGSPSPVAPTPVTIPPNPDKGNGNSPPSGEITNTGTLQAQEDPTWKLFPGTSASESELYDQDWIDTNFKSTKGQENFNILYSGIEKLVVPYIRSGGFLAYGENAFAAMAVPGKPQASFAAGATYVSGKVFIFGHSEWLTEFAPYSPISFKNSSNNVDVSQLPVTQNMGTGIPGNPSEAKNQVTYLKNVLIWQLGNNYKNLLGTNGPNISFLTNTNAPFHQDFKLTGNYVPNFFSPISPLTYPLVVLGYSGLTDLDVTNLLEYLKNGGKILIAVWPNYGKNLEYINKILKPVGIKYYATYDQSVNFDKPSLTDLKNSQFNLHSFYSLSVLEKNQGSEEEIERRKLEIALIPADDSAFSSRIVKDYEGVTIGFPFKKRESPFKFGLLLFRNYYGKANPNDETEVPVAEGVDQFPGTIPLGTPLVERDFIFNLKFSKNSAYRENLPPPNWQATGLYAPPGQTITVEVNKGGEEVLKNFRIFINTHTDDLTFLNPSIDLHRHPLLTSYHYLKFGENKIRNPFGGLIVLEGLIESNQDQLIELTISDAVEAPWLKEDTTDTELNRLKNLNVPWGIIQGPRSVAIVPIENFKQITSAKKIRDAWTYFHVLEDRVTGKYETGKTFPDLPENWEAPHKWPDGRTWHVIDTQIGGGDAHAGNPVMYIPTYGSFFVNETKILSDAWTLWHEMGHNHQQQAWTTSLDQEVTTNILSAYMQNNGYKYLQPPISAPPFRIEVKNGFKIAVDRLKAAEVDIYKSPGEFEKTINPSNPNVNDPYRRLIFFMQLIRYTEKNSAPGGLKGYDIISELYRRVRNYTDAYYKELIKSDQSKTDNLCRELSDIAKIDLTDFFEKWGRSISNSVEQEIKGEGYLQPSTAKPIWKCDPYNPAADNPC